MFIQTSSTNSRGMVLMAHGAMADPADHAYVRTFMILDFFGALVPATKAYY